MAEMISLRARRLQERKAQELAAIQAATPGRLEEMSRKGSETAKLGIILAQEAQTQKDASKPPSTKVTGTKRASTEAKGKGLPEQATKRTKASNPVRELQNAPFPIAWFSHIHREEDEYPDYSKFAHRKEVESAWNMMSKFCAENTHAFIQYEASLKSMRDENADLREQLKDAKDKAESAQSSVKLKVKYAKNLEAKLKEKDDTIASLKGDLELAQQSRFNLEERIREETFGLAEKRFRTVARRLRAFREGPVERLNLYGQAKINLELIEALQGPEAPTLESEKADNEADLLKYSSAHSDFEKAYNRLQDLLLVKLAEVVPEDSAEASGDNIEAREKEDASVVEGELDMRQQLPTSSAPQDDAINEEEDAEPSKDLSANLSEAGAKENNC